LVARLVYHAPVHFTTYLSDYRTVHGLKIPFHTRSTAGHGQVTQEKKATVNVPLIDKDFAVPGQHLNDSSFVDGGNVATIPFELIDNHIHIQVKINGHPFHFILDSGSVNVLSPQAAKTAGVKANGALAAHGTGSRTVNMGLAKVKDIVLGNKAALRNQTFYVIPLPSVSTSIRLDGTVGYGIFKHFVVSIDYAKHLLTLIRPRDFSPKGAGVAVPLHSYNGDKVTVKGSIDGLAGYFLLDTGNGGSLSLFAPFAKANNLYARYDTTPPVVTGFGVGGVTKGRVARGGKLTIGSVAVNDPVVALRTTKRGGGVDKTIVGNIGARILKRFTVTFDYADKVMYLKPNENYGKPMNYDRSGMAFKQTRQGFPVVGVMKGGPAAQAGIKIGDIITAVDGKPASEMTRLAFRAMLRNETPGTKVKLTIGKDSAAHVVTITLRRLIPKTGGLKKAA
ncbi:MAG: aspartyl protease family protein, partial [Gammaproteobacteria bacterium]